MKVLIVYSHPNPESFTAALRDSFARGLAAGGHEYQVVDLYGENFNPNFGLEDYNAFIGGQVPADVKVQQEKVKWADAFAFICPVFWMNLPANMIGWIVRVFSYGFAYSLTDEGWKGHVSGRVGLLTQKKALVMSPTFFSEKDYNDSGMREAMEKLICRYGFKYPGVQEARYKFFYRTLAVDDVTRKKYLDEAFRLGKEF